MTDCVLLTEAKYLTPDNADWYKSNVLREQQLVIDALKRRGLLVEKRPWDDRFFDWHETQLVLVREVWDYFHRFDDFIRVIEKISAISPMMNSFPLICWNMDKHYLHQLESRGVNVVKSKFIEPGNRLELSGILRETGWPRAVVKPVVSGAARLTFLLDSSNCAEIDRQIADYRFSESFMIQPFVESVPAQGEISLIYFGKRFSHAVIKKAKAGDFRVQDDWGGKVEDYIPSEEQISFGLTAIEACSELPAYSRVDVVTDNDGRLAIGELELVEPELWFRRCPQAADLLADEVIKRLG